jgi:hypothetical protein
MVGEGQEKSVIYFTGNKYCNKTSVVVCGR